MFITVESFVDSFLKLRGEATKEQLKEILDKMKKTFDKSTYAQTVTVLEVLTLEQK
jgi:hypothetical protein